MRASWRHAAAVALAAALLCAGSVRAQEFDGARLVEALELTQQRIDSAAAVVPDKGDAPEIHELRLARDLQARARVAVGRGRPLIAHRATIEARMHAERAISISRGLPDPERVMIQLERTSELLERAGDLLSGCREPRASALLRTASGMQERATTAGDEGRFLAALQLTLSARQRVEKAMRLCNVVEDLGATVARGLSRTDQALESAKRAAADGAPPQARRDLRRAIELQREALSERDAQHLERALQLTQLARGIANRIARRLPPPGVPPGAPPPPPPHR